MNDTVTRYCHVDGFQDGTRYLEVDGAGVVTAVTWSGKREDVSRCYRKADCEEKVAQGKWEVVA